MMLLVFNYRVLLNQMVLKSHFQNDTTKKQKCDLIQIVNNSWSDNRQINCYMSSINYLLL